MNEDSIEEVDQNTNLLARYTQAGSVDEPLAEMRSGTTSYYHQDGLGSVTSLSNSSGSLANTYVYNSFGDLVTSSGTITNPFQYTGRNYDPEIGLRYYRARYYDPSIGRFLSEDPLQFGAGVNFYSYVNNLPTLFIDPFGLQGGMGPTAPPMSVPGAPNSKWVWPPDPNNGRGGTYQPDVWDLKRGPKPTASWEHVGKGKKGRPGHWDVDDGNGNRQRYDRRGNKITPEQAHGQNVEIAPAAQPVDIFCRPGEIYDCVPRELPWYPGMSGPIPIPVNPIIPNMPTIPIRIPLEFPIFAW